MATNPSIVLATGAYHSPSHYTAFSNALAKLGYDQIVTPELPSTTGVVPQDPMQSLAHDTKVLHEAIAKELNANRNVVLLCHSWGGIPGGSDAPYGLPEAQSGKVGKLLGIIFVSALVPDVGQSLVTCMTGGHAEWVRMSEDFSISWPDNPAQNFYNDTPDGPEKEEALAKITNQVGASFISTAEHAEWKKYPCFYVRCAHDNGVVPMQQDWQIKRMKDAVADGGRGVEVVELEIDHVPFLSIPAEFAQKMDSLVRKLASDL